MPPIYTVSGMTVTRNARPRFRATLTPRGDGGYDTGSEAIEWIDNPPPDPAILSRIMREAGDALLESLR